MIRIKLAVALGMFLVASVMSALTDKRSGDPVVLVRATDAELGAARNLALQTLPEFVAALENPAPGQETMLLKARFEDNGAVEHMWLTNVKHEGGSFTGEVNNDPQSVQNVKFGERVTVTQADVSDWMFFEGGEMRGGYSVKVLLDRSAQHASR